MPFDDPDAGPEPTYKHGWWIAPAVILFVCLCLIAVLLILPRLPAGAGASFFAILLTGSILTGLLSKLMVKK